MKKIISILMIFLSLCILVACNKNKETKNVEKPIDPLVVNGSSSYSVVIADDASECITYAAEELTSFIFQSTGVVLNIIKDSSASYGNENYISIGNNSLLENTNFNVDYSSLNQDGFIIKYKNKTIFINGYLERGTLYGVYDFLERYLGIRFLTSDCTHVPENKIVKLNEMDITEIPDFTCRLYLDCDTYAYFGNAQFTARSRQDTGYLWYVDSKYGEDPSMYMRYSDHNMHYFVDESIYNDPNKPETYHPEFYYVFPEPYTSYGPGVCISNGITESGELDETMDISVAKIVIEEMKKDILANPQAIYFLFEQEDSQHCCDCDKCQKNANKYQRSGMLIRFCNLISRELKKWAKEEGVRDNFKIVTFAYIYTNTAPVKEENGKFVPIDNTVIADKDVVIRMAGSYDANYSYFDEKQDNHNRLQNWKMCASNFMMWIHDKDFADYISYYPTLDDIKSNVIGMYNYGVTYAFMQGAQNCYNDWQSLLRGYIYRNLFWDTSLNTVDLANEFIELYWGDEASKYIKEFIDNYEKNYAISRKNHPDYLIATSQTKYLDPSFGCISLAFLNKQIDLIEAAKEAVNNNDKYSSIDKQVYLKRLAQCEATPKYTIMRFYDKFYSGIDSDAKMKFVNEVFDIIDLAGFNLVSELISVEAAKESWGIK